MLTGLAVIVVVAVLSTSLYALLNRKTAASIKEMRRTLRKQVQTLAPHSIDEFIDRCGIANEDKKAACALLASLAQIIDVSPEHLADDYPLHQILTITIVSGAQEELLAKHVDLFTNELIERVAAESDPLRWKQRWRETGDLPNTENDLADFIVEMTVGEFLRFFSPLMKKELKEQKGSN